MKCPICGSTKVALNPLTGEIVCSTCGAVLEENPIDDTYTRDRRIPYYESLSSNYRARARFYKVLTLDSRNWGLKKANSHNTNRPSLKGDHPRLNHIVGFLTSELMKNRSFKSRTLTAIAIYVAERSEGASKNAAMRSASKLAGVSLKTLERIIREYRDDLEDAIRRVARSDEGEDVQQPG
ncbi:MAG: TFIIB-type zinc ribbon-containing protein [Desulfurococcales archaeon]|nr:TFIIB-type zinc ribbon-containing protein [Desulfurococcales archaeon]